MLKKVQPLEWFEANCKKDAEGGYIRGKNCVYFSKHMIPLCDEEILWDPKTKMGDRKDSTGLPWRFQEWMFVHDYPQTRVVHSLKWFKRNCHANDLGYLFTDPMALFCGKEVTWYGRTVEEDALRHSWEEWMFKPYKSSTIDLRSIKVHGLNSKPKVHDTPHGKIKKTVHTMAWFEKNCTKINNWLGDGYYFKPKKDTDYADAFTDHLFPYCGNLVTWDPGTEKIEEDDRQNHWESWMFESDLVEYFFIDDTGCISSDHFEGSVIDHYRLSVGNVFESALIAQNYLAWCGVRNKIEVIAFKNNDPEKKDNWTWILSYSIHNNLISQIHVGSERYGLICCNNPNFLQLVKFQLSEAEIFFFLTYQRPIFIPGKRG